MRWLNVPNLLTLARLALAPVAVWAIIDGQYGRALGVFVLAAITDGLDGPLARHYGTITRFGAYMDPVADKMLLSASFIALGIAGLAPWWLVILIFGRDLLILLLVGLALLFTPFRNFPPSIWGKLSTAVQVITVVVLVAVALYAEAYAWVGSALIWMSAAATIWSGFDYLCKAIRRASSLKIHR